MCSIAYAINSTTYLKKQTHDFVAGVPVPFARGIDRVKETFNITFTTSIKKQLSIGSVSIDRHIKSIDTDPVDLRIRAYSRPTC